MKHLFAAMLVGMLMLFAETAEAQSCGAPSSSSSSSSEPSSSSDSDSDSGGGSSSSSSGWGDSGDYDGGDYDSGSSSSSSSNSSSSARQTCRDSTDVTGLEQCTRFGSEWNSSWPALRLEIGPSFRRLSLDGLNVGGTTYHDGNPHRFTLDANDLEDPTVLTGGLNFRFTVPIASNFLLGAEFDFSGGGDLDGAVSLGDRQLTVGDVLSVGGGLVLGVTIPVGPVRFRGEVLAGGQGVTVTTTSHLGDCVSEDTTTITRWVVEPRVGLELFVTRWLSIDVWGGADVINTGTFSGGLRLNLHTRAYDAVR
jgi:hypothetical protein